MNIFKNERNIKINFNRYSQPIGPLIYLQYYSSTTALNGIAEVVAFTFLNIS